MLVSVFLPSSSVNVHAKPEKVRPPVDLFGIEMSLKRSLTKGVYSTP
jgi:hypothetical protein